MSKALGARLLPSCKARYFCPSCHQKRVLGDWVEANVLARAPFALEKMSYHAGSGIVL